MLASVYCRHSITKAITKAIRRAPFFSADTRNLRNNMRLLVLTIAAAIALMPRGATATELDENAQRAIDSFDIKRAFISDKQIFAPYRITETQKLGDALAARKVTGDMRLLILERDEGMMAFLVQQIAYHHVAQGDMKGEPYMVSF